MQDNPLCFTNISSPYVKKKGDSNGNTPMSTKLSLGTTTKYQINDVESMMLLKSIIDKHFVDRDTVAFKKALLISIF